MKYRKKPVVVEAEQWRGIYERGELVVPDPPQGVVWKRRWWWPFVAIPMIRTLEGWLRVRQPRMRVQTHAFSPPSARVVHGDYIVHGTFGERWPVRPDIFEATYEAVAP